MGFEAAKSYLEERGYGDRIRKFEVSSATVALAARALGTEPERIAKSMGFMVEGKPVMVVCAGDVKINNSKYKKFFGVKAKMLSPDEVSELVGHNVGGVCPFGINPGVDVYLDESLKRFDVVYPACGDSSSSVELAVPELEALIENARWTDVCKPANEE